MGRETIQAIIQFLLFGVSCWCFASLFFRLLRFKAMKLMIRRCLRRCQKHPISNVYILNTLAFNFFHRATPANVYSLQNNKNKSQSSKESGEKVVRSKRR